MPFGPGALARLVLEFKPINKFDPYNLLLISEFRALSAFFYNVYHSMQHERSIFACQF